MADVIGTFRMLAQLPTDSLGAYIISMSHTASDVLAVVLMQKECGGELRVCMHVLSTKRDCVWWVGLGWGIGHRSFKLSLTTFTCT